MSNMIPTNTGSSRKIRPVEDDDEMGLDVTGIKSRGRQPYRSAQAALQTMPLRVRHSNMLLIS